MNEKQRMALARRVQKKIATNNPYLRLIEEGRQILKELKQNADNKRKRLAAVGGQK